MILIYNFVNIHTLFFFFYYRLPDLLCALAGNKLPQYTYNNTKNTLIKVLVNTFSLSAANVIFKTAEWTLVGLIIIKM